MEGSRGLQDGERMQKHGRSRVVLFKQTLPREPFYGPKAVIYSVCYAPGPGEPRMKE